MPNAVADVSGMSSRGAAPGGARLPSSTDQIHAFTFKSLGNGFYAGEHSWDIPAKNLKSHDGKQSTFTATEPFLDVVASDGTLWLVEQGDTTNFHLRLVARDRIEFVGMEGGEHPVVGRGSLTRE